MSAVLLRPLERAAAGALGLALLVPPALARLDGSERWFLDWLALAAFLLFAAATGLRRGEAADAAGSADEPESAERTPLPLRAAMWIARLGAVVIASLVFLHTLSATLGRRWDSLSAPLVLLAVAAIFAAIHGSSALQGAPAGTPSERP